MRLYITVILHHLARESLQHSVRLPVLGGLLQPNSDILFDVIGWGNEFLESFCTSMPFAAVGFLLYAS